MGNNESNISHETVDQTSPSARAEGEQQARDENERRMRELEEEIERDRERALEEAREQAWADDIQQRIRFDQLKREREERERKYKEEAKLLEMKNLILNYNFQENPLIRKEAFRDLDIEDIDVVRIALIGPTGSGKTCFIGTIQSALGQTQTAFEMGPGREGTILLDEYVITQNISIVDTRGFFEVEEHLVEECLDIMSGRIRPADEIVREYDVNQGDQRTGRVTSAPGNAAAFAKYAHAVIFVVKANDPRLTEGNYDQMLRIIRKRLREDGYTPVTVVTCLDKLNGSEEQKELAFDKASTATGSPLDRTHFIQNYIHDLPGKSMTTERTALEVLEFALMSAESFIRVRKQRELNQRERGVGAGVTPGGVETVEQLFTRLQRENHWENKERVKKIVSIIRQNEIQTVPVLKELWEDIKPKLSLTIGMKVVLEKEMKNL